MVALPPGELEGEAWQAWAGPIVDQVVTFLADGYEVAIRRPVGDDEADRFRAALDAAGGRDAQPPAALDG